MTFEHVDETPVAWNQVCGEPECQRTPNRCDHVTEGYLQRCAEGEGGRAALAMQGYGNAHTAAYFAREAAHYARLLLEAQGSECNDLAECGACGRNRPVCCDEGYSEDPETGVLTHVGAVCVDCCQPHHKGGSVWHGKSVAGGTYERCE